MSTIKLAVERFWVESGNFELWPEILSRLPRQMDAVTVKEMAEKYLQKDVSGKNERLDKSKELYGLMGLAIRGRPQRAEIKGVRLIQLTDNGMALTEDALRLVECYRSGGNWEVLLALQLLKYSPRCRAVFYPLWAGGIMKCKGLLLENLSKAELYYNGKSYFPFAWKQGEQGMNRLLADFREEALGPYWQRVLEEAGIILSHDWEFTGSIGAAPSDGKLSLSMRSPLALFHYLDLLEEGPGGEVSLNKSKVEDDLQGEKLFIAEGPQPISTLNGFRQLVYEYGDYRGFFPVEPVLKELQKRFFPEWRQGIDRFIDYFLTSGIKEGKFQIVANESGQPRHGRGYLGKRQYQLLKLQFFKRG